jgi:hypothetical protein
MLTGRQRYRKSWFGKLILQVEEALTIYESAGPSIESRDVTIWRDASIKDLTVTPLPAA